MGSNFKKVTYIENNTKSKVSIELAKEEPLSIRVNGNPYSIVMRTPGNEKEHAAGLCLAEGIIDKIEDISSIGFCDGADTNVVTITLTALRNSKISNLFERKGYISNTSCGICGKEIIEDINTITDSIQDGVVLKATTVISNLSKLSKYQPIREKTRATHCSAIYSKESKCLSSAEDIGRHNAMDKSIGILLMRRVLSEAKIITLSSRISYELVQKAARAKIPVIAAISRPTSLAVDLAAKLNITLATLSPKKGLIIYCNKHRLSQ